MRLGGRLSAAVEVLEDIGNRHRPVAAALRDWGLAHRFAGSGDRAAIGNIVYDALRHKLSIADRMGSDDSRALAVGVMFEWGISSEQLVSTLEGDRFVAEGIADLARADRPCSATASSADNVTADVPQWCVPHLRESFADRWIEEAARLADRPPLDLRVNRLNADREKVLKALAKTGAVPTALSPDGLRIPSTSGDRRHPNVQSEPGFQKGWFEIQDEGSQLAALLAGAAAGGQVLDLCAGAGGKTLALSAMMQNRGQIFAFDADKSRLAPIFDRLKRAGSRNVQAIADGQALEPLKDRMDLVLVDAPCTGSGTWRRRPDAKWRLSAEQLQTRMNEQNAVLGQAVEFVKPGGRLAYVTCSVFKAENDDRIEALLGNCPGFSQADHGLLWNGVVPDRTDAMMPTDHGLMLTPARSDTDGFYLSVLQRDD